MKNRTYNTSNTYRISLIKEFREYNRQGVKLCIRGREIGSEPELADLILNERGFTYMRNYEYEDGKIVKIEFDKVRLAKKK